MRDFYAINLSKLCFATTEGVSLLGINEAANTLGLHTVCARATTDMLSNEPLPCILYGGWMTLFLKRRKVLD